MNEQTDDNNYIVSKEDMKNIFYNRSIISKKEYITYLYYKTINEEKVI